MSRAQAQFKASSKRYARDARLPYFQSIEFIPRDSSMLTQPGDFLAFAVGKHLDDLESKKDNWCRPIFGTIKPEKCGYTYTKEKARSAIARIQNDAEAAIKRGIYI
jgi:hypothetical protein